MTAVATDGAGHGQSGEERIRAKRRRAWWIWGGIVVLSFIPGFYMGFTGKSVIRDGGTWPAPVVIVTAIIYVAIIVGGNLLLRRHIDELAMHNRLRAIALAGMIYMVVYPVWWLLWMGALVPEPSHWQLFLLFYASFVAGCGWYARNAI